MLRPLRSLRSRTGCLDGLEYLWLEITRSCNLKCRHCYAGSGPAVPLEEDMSYADWCLVMARARELGCRRVQFIGGEPTIHPDLVDLLRYAYDVGFTDRVVSTNATRLTDELLNAFEQIGVKVSVSFFSFDPDVHDRIVGRERAFEQTVEGIERLVRRRIPVQAGVILMDENATHLRRARRLLRRLGVRFVGKDRVRGVGRGANYVPDRSPAEELCGGCWKGKLCIASNGDAYPCVFSRFAPVGNFLSDGLEPIVQGDRLRAFRRAVYLGQNGGTE